MIGTLGYQKALYDAHKANRAAQQYENQLRLMGQAYGGAGTYGQAANNSQLQAGQIAKFKQQAYLDQMMQNAYTGMALTTGGPSYAATQASLTCNHTGHAACGDSREVHQEPQIIRKTFLTEETRSSTKPSSQSPISLKTSPLFGRPAFGMFYNWTFDSPFKRLRMWLFRWAYGIVRT